MHHAIRAATMTEVTATKIRVGQFEIWKQNSNSAIENVTILSTDRKVFHRLAHRKSE